MYVSYVAQTLADLPKKQNLEMKLVPITRRHPAGLSFVLT